MRFSAARAATVAVVAISLGAGCGRGGTAGRDVTFSVAASARLDWPATVAPCMDAAWEWRIAERSEDPTRIRVLVPAEQLGADRFVPAVTCLEARPGVVDADVLAAR